MASSAGRGGVHAVGACLRSCSPPHVRMGAAGTAVPASAAPVGRLGADAVCFAVCLCVYVCVCMCACVRARARPLQAPPPPPPPAKSVGMCGWLTKKGEGMLAKAKRRYFILEGDSFLYKEAEATPAVLGSVRAACCWGWGWGWGGGWGWRRVRCLDRVCVPACSHTHLCA